MIGKESLHQSLELEFPSEWTYTLIGTDSQAMAAAVASIFKAGSYSLKVSKKSSGGKYVSLEIRVQVESKEQKDTWYNALASNTAIKMVL